MGVAREGVARELLSLYRKNYVAAGIVFMLDNYGARDRIETGARNARQGVAKNGWPRKSFSADRRGRAGRRPNAIRLMNRNNSRAIVLFGSFQLTRFASEPDRFGTRRMARRRFKGRVISRECASPLVIMIFRRMV